MHNDAILIKEQRIVDEAIRAIESVSVLLAGERDGLAHSGTTVRFDRVTLSLPNYH